MVETGPGSHKAVASWQNRAADAGPVVQELVHRHQGRRRMLRGVFR